MISLQEITGVILCGGQGARMHGVDKPLLPLSGIPLVQHVRERLAPQVSSVIISANRHGAEYAAWGDIVVADTEADCGPLGGLHSCMNFVQTPYVFCCPGDAPWLPTTVVGSLVTALNSSGASVAFPHDGERAQHLFVLLSINERAGLADYLKAGQRSVGGWIATTNHVSVDWSRDRDAFTNINTEIQRRAAERPRHDSATQPAIQPETVLECQ